MPPSPSAAPATALETIYRRHQGLVRWVLRARGVPEAALDDHVHDVFLAILRRLPEREPTVPMRAWVAGVARNVSFSHRRAAARQQQRALRLVPPDDPPRPDEVLERREAWEALSEFLDDLGPEQREVFVMVEVTGMRVSELAESTGLPANTLHSRLKVARTRFSQRFAAPVEQRGELLQRAREQGRTDAKERRRTWGMIAASIEGLPAGTVTSASTGVAASTAWGLGSSTWIAVTLAVGVLGAAAVVGPSRARPEPEGLEVVDAGRVAAAASPSVAPAVEPPPAAPHLAPASPPAPEGAPPRKRARSEGPGAASSAMASATGGSPQPVEAASLPTAVPSPTDPDAELVRATAAIERARAELERGRARRALAALDRPGSFGVLERERRRLELEAACRLGDASRSRLAAAALVELGAAVDHTRPCEEIGE